MAPHKQLLFLGRQDADTGFKDCIELAHQRNWDLQAIKDVEDVKPYIQKADYVFAGGYLVALEAFLAKKVVLISFTNAVKKDYWQMHPMFSEMGANGDVPTKYSQKAYDWAKQQTWEKLADEYEQLWKK